MALKASFMIDKRSAWLFSPSLSRVFLDIDKLPGVFSHLKRFDEIKNACTGVTFAVSCWEQA